MNSINKRIARIRRQHAFLDAERGVNIPASAIMFEAPRLNVDGSERSYRAWGHGLYVCLHNVPYVCACRRCRRTETNANENFHVLCDSIKRRSLAEMQIT